MKVIKIQIFWDTPPPRLPQTPLTNVWRWIWFLALNQSKVLGTWDVGSGMIRSLDPIIYKWKIAQLKTSRFQFNVLRPFAKQGSGACSAIEGADSKRPLVLGPGLTEANIVNGPVPTPCTLVLHTHTPCYMPAICIDHTCCTPRWARCTVAWWSQLLGAWSCAPPTLAITFPGRGSITVWAQQLQLVSGHASEEGRRHRGNYR